MSIKGIFPNRPLAGHDMVPVGPVEIAGHTTPPPTTGIQESPPMAEKHIAGVREVHPEDFGHYRHLPVIVPASLAAGSEILNGQPVAPNSAQLNQVNLDFQAQSIVVDNPSGYTLFFPDLNRQVPGGSYNVIIRCFPAITRLRCIVQSGSQTTSILVTITAYERPFGLSSYWGGGVAPAGSYVSALNVQTQFGAKGDNVTDDTTAIQNAINAAANLQTGRGLVYFPPGTYLISSNIDTKGCHLMGAGLNITYITANTVFTGGMLNSVLGQNFTTISFMTINGNSQAQYCIDGSNMYNSTFQFVRCQNATSHGWFMSSSGVAGQTGAEWLFCWGSTNGGDGFHLQGAGGGFFDGHFIGCETLTNTGWGFNISGGEIRLTDCIATSDVAGSAQLTGGEYTVTNPWFSSNAAIVLSAVSVTGRISVMGGTIQDIQGTDPNTANRNLMRFNTCNSVRVVGTAFLFNNVAGGSDTGLACVFLFTAIRVQLAACTFEGSASVNVTAIQMAGGGGNTFVDIGNMDFSQVGSGQGVVNPAGATFTRWTDNGTLASIGVGNTSVVVNHGLAATPQEVFITPTVDPQFRWWVSTLTATQFTINLSTAAAGSAVTFRWRASIYYGA
jgi:hypothetical protein